MRDKMRHAYAQITGVWIDPRTEINYAKPGQSRHAFDEYKTGARVALAVVLFTVAVGAILAAITLALI